MANAKGTISEAAALMGRKGGRKKVPKGFSVKTPAERKQAGQRGMIRRWGRSAEITLKIQYLPGAEDRIIEEGKKLMTFDQNESELRQALGAIFYDHIAQPDMWRLGIDIPEIDKRKLWKKVEIQPSRYERSFENTPQRLTKKGAE